MPFNRQKLTNPIFDIKPVDESGRVDFDKISKIQETVNLTGRIMIRKGEARAFMHENKGKASLILKKENYKSEPRPESEPKLKSKPVSAAHKDSTKSLEDYLSSDLDIQVELASIGAEIKDQNRISKPRYKLFKIRSEAGINDEAQTLELLKSDLPEVEDFYQKPLSAIHKRDSITPELAFIGEPRKIDLFNLGLVKSNPVRSSSEIDFLLAKSKNQKSEIRNKSRFKKILSGLGLVSAIIIITSISYFGGYGWNLKDRIFQQGSAAVQNLQNANSDIKAHDFASAADNFTRAYNDFASAGDNLNFIGAGIRNLLADLPGAGRLKSAQNLIEAGKLIASSGQAMSEAIDEASKTAVIFNPNALQGISIGQIISKMQSALSLSSKNFKKAEDLLADINKNDLPQDKITAFDDFNSKLPVLEKLISDSSDYSNFLKNFIGLKGAKTYLVLFQNQAELRPTGGFPGSYGVISFKDGRLVDFKVDDIYNLDGQLEELIIPPLQLQHITPNWTMRDSAWFVDFPTSARKVSSFFSKEAGYSIDGVITLNPKIISQLLDIVGPVKMPEYGLTLTSQNFSDALQNEIEYKADRSQPKKILNDLAPLLLRQLYSADSQKWLSVFNLIVSDIGEKDILAYFNDQNLESFVLGKGLSGQVENSESDYLMVDFTNIKGSKTDAVIDNSLKVETSFQNGTANHKITITRKHNGGDMKYGFYNKINPTYVRILVPEGSKLLSLSGNSNPNYEPMLDYAKSGFKVDDDLKSLELGARADKTSELTYREAGKTEFGFWMITNPGDTKTIILEYSTPINPSNYNLYIQKQPGMDASLEVTQEGKEIYNGKLDKDLEL